MFKLNMIIPSEIAEKFQLEPEYLKNGRTKYKLFNHYAIELLESNDKLLYEVFWEDIGRRIGFSEGELSGEEDLVYFIEYTGSCISTYE